MTPPDPHEPPGDESPRRRRRRADGGVPFDPTAWRTAYGDVARRHETGDTGRHYFPSFDDPPEQVGRAEPEVRPEHEGPPEREAAGKPEPVPRRQESRLDEKPTAEGKTAAEHPSDRGRRAEGMRAKGRRPGGSGSARQAPPAGQEPDRQPTVVMRKEPAVRKEAVGRREPADREEPLRRATEAVATDATSATEVIRVDRSAEQPPASTGATEVIRTDVNRQDSATEVLPASRLEPATQAITRKPAGPEPVSDRPATVERPESEDPVEAAPRRPRPDGRAPDRETVRRRRRIAIVLALIVAIVLAAAVGYGAYRYYYAEGDDYSGGDGTSDVLVEIPAGATVMEVATVLTTADVVGSTDAFVKAAGDGSVDPGFYKMRTHISGAAAFERITKGDKSFRVGRVVIGERQLDDKPGADGKTTPGILSQLADATHAELNGATIGVTEVQLREAAVKATPDELGIPQWARAAVVKLPADHRKLEGLIAPGTYESLDPRLSARDLLRSLITASAAQYEGAGLLTEDASGLTPYEKLVAASIVGHEVDPNSPDAAKVARVVLNRLAKKQRLEMDSTVNYAARVNDIDLGIEQLVTDNAWNTYRNVGLPVTPISAVGRTSLQAIENPAEGDWLYFVTVDRDGKTLFATTFEQHERNRQEACRTGLLKKGCEQ